MAELSPDILERLDKNDKEKLSYFIEMLLKQSKYQKLKKEIYMRRQEIEKGETLTHEDIWKEVAG